MKVRHTTIQGLHKRLAKRQRESDTGEVRLPAGLRDLTTSAQIHISIFVHYICNQSHPASNSTKSSAQRELRTDLVSDVCEVLLQLLNRTVKEPMGLQVCCTEGQEVNSCQACLLTRRCKNYDGFLG